MNHPHGPLGPSANANTFLLLLLLLLLLHYIPLMRLPQGGRQGLSKKERGVESKPLPRGDKTHPYCESILYSIALYNNNDDEFIISLLINFIIIYKNIDFNFLNKLDIK